MAILAQCALALLAATTLAGCGDTTIVQPTKTVVAAPSSALAEYRVPAGSMEPTLPIGMHVFLQVANYSPKVGDIVVFHPPRDAEQEVCGPVPHTVRPGGAACAEPEPEQSSVRFVKRIVAGPGDTISIVDGHVIRNGTREPDAYIRPCAGVSECNFPTPIKVPAHHWFMVGDNRGESDDSRFWGPVPTSWIVGGVVWCNAVGHPCPAA